MEEEPLHKIGGLREWLAARSVELLFLPPYSPYFSPIEQAWSRLKTKLRSCAARSSEALQAALHEAIDWISSQDARNWFDHCGIIPTLPEKRLNRSRNCYKISAL